MGKIKEMATIAAEIYAQENQISFDDAMTWVMSQPFNTVEDLVSKHNHNPNNILDRIANIERTQAIILSKISDLEDSDIKTKKIEYYAKLDKLIKEYFESHIGDTITKEMIDNIWPENKE